MLDVVADLHLHSKYSRAVSPQMTIPFMAQVGKQKGIDILATGDWTHPLWYRELKNYLEESEEGLYTLKSQISNIKYPISNEKIASSTSGGLAMTQKQNVRFLLSVEIATIFTQGGKGRRIHNLVFVPSFEVAEKVQKELLKRGFNLSSDGRPILGQSCKNLLHMLLEIDERNLLIPAHAWTPWFGIYGAMSGFESLEEAFEDLAPYVYGIETGLSSDPEMNWQMKELDTRSILSFSDAHSAPKMAREATVFRLERLSYENIRAAIMQPSKKVISSQLLVHSKEKPSPQTLSQEEREIKDNLINKVLYTVEFYPEEGKYHYSGHRNCNVTMTPEEQRVSNGICPVCKRKVTDGVMRRVQELADRDARSTSQELRSKLKENAEGLQWVTDPRGKHPPFIRLVPLLEIIAEALEVPVGSPKAKVVFDELTNTLASELDILLKTPQETIEKVALHVSSFEKAKRVAEGVQKVREAHIVIKPGYDGVYGVVKIWPPSAEATEGLTNKEKKEEKSQIGLEF